MTLDLLRPVRYNPKLSAYSYQKGIHIFATIPLVAPARIKVVIHMKPKIGLRGIIMVKRAGMWDQY